MPLSRVVGLAAVSATVLLASACGASSLSPSAMEQQLVSRGLAAADCRHSGSVKKRFAYGKAEHRAQGVTWCRVRYPSTTGWTPLPVQVMNGALVVLPSRGCLEWNQLLAGRGGFGNYVETDGFGARARCREGRGIGWYLTAGWGRDERFVSDPIEYATPVGVVAVYRYAPHELPAVLAQVGIPGTGQLYELFTFRGRKIVPVRITAKAGSIGGLAGGGAAFHGQGVFCSHRGNELVLTQLYWDGPTPNAPSHRAKGGGTEFDGGDNVTANYERWTFGGTPLVQRSVAALPSRTLTYRRANALENAHCG